MCTVFIINIYFERGTYMPRKKPTKKDENRSLESKFFKTVEQMSAISGIGENTLRSLIEKGEIDHIAIGNRRLIADSAMWDWYERNKVSTAEYEERENKICRLQPKDKTQERKKRCFGHP